jgi:hypothetical protein
MLDIFQFHHLVSEEFQCPALSPIRGLATGQMNQLGLALAIQAAPFGPFSREASHQSQLQASLGKSLLDANHRAATDGEGLGNLPIGVAGVAFLLITHQQNAGYQIVLGWSPARVDHHLQPWTLLLTQSHGIAVVRGSHVCTPYCVYTPSQFSPGEKRKSSSSQAETSASAKMVC